MFSIKCDGLEWWCWKLRPSVELAMQLCDDKDIRGDVEIRDGSGLVLKFYRNRQS